MNYLNYPTSRYENYISSLLQAAGVKTYWFKKIDSTNSEAKRLINSNKYTLPTLIGSERQLSGYGKLNRRFISEIGGLYFSLIIRVPNLTYKNQGLLTTGVAWQLHLAIKNCLGINTKVKWVNDLIFNKKKVAGILIENLHDQIVIIGIGCNLFQEFLEKDIKTAGNLLKQEPNLILLSQLVVEIVNRLINFTNHFCHYNFLDDYKRNMVFLNETVKLKIGKKIIQGKIINLTPYANLVFKTDNGILLINSGEIIKP